MSAIRWLAAGAEFEGFPSPDDALDEPNGLLAAGGDLGPNRLLLAYRSGIFPWYERGQPILWWSPNPRAVLRPDDLRVSRSMRRVLNRRLFHITADRAFEDVLLGCAGPRSYGSATWITDEMADAYTRLHELGWAHSFEAWSNGKLAGGLYGVAIGRVFFGESMFSKQDNSSKAALISAIRYLTARGFKLIDCQVASAHMRSLGAVDIPRARFLQRLKLLCEGPQGLRSWTNDHAEWSQSTEKGG